MNQQYQVGDTVWILNTQFSGNKLSELFLRRIEIEKVVQSSSGCVYYRNEMDDFPIDNDEMFESLDAVRECLSSKTNLIE